MATPPHCSLPECLHVSQHAKELTYDELTRQLALCKGCEQGVFKENDTAQKTYQLVSLYWAQAYNNVVGHMKRMQQGYGLQIADKALK